MRLQYVADEYSAELEMTVNMLIQIDKLVQLLESPVFTCQFSYYYWEYALNPLRSSSSAPRTRKIPLPL
jgi:hypothetical protein